MSGNLYVLSTPIGNLNDISLKLINILYKTDIILVESKLKTLRLLKHIGLNYKYKKIISLRNHSQSHIYTQLSAYILKGLSVTLCSDAGAPTISDPGNRIINRIKIDDLCSCEFIQGSNALISSVASSGLMCGRFLFLGFLPQNRKRRKLIIRNAFFNGESLVIYESPRRINNLINEIFLFYGFSRFAVARELTKIHETLHYGVIKKFIYPYMFYKGECVVVVEHPKYYV